MEMQSAKVAIAWSHPTYDSHRRPKEGPTMATELRSFLGRKADMNQSVSYA